MLMQLNVDATACRHYSHLLRYWEEIPLGDETVPRCCENCRYYRPEWKYRICKFSRCKYGKDINPFRFKPLPFFEIPNEYRRYMDLYEASKEAFGW